MEQRTNSLSDLIVTIDHSQQEAVDQFKKMFRSIILDFFLDEESGLEFISLQDNDSDEIITWLNENHPDIAWDVSRFEQSDEILTLLAKSESYDNFSIKSKVSKVKSTVKSDQENQQNEESEQADQEEQSEQNEKVSQADQNEQDSQDEDDFEGEIPDEESGISNDPDDVEYNQATSDFARDKEIENGDIYREAYEEHKRIHPEDTPVNAEELEASKAVEEDDKNLGLGDIQSVDSANENSDGYEDEDEGEEEIESSADEEIEDGESEEVNEDPEEINQVIDEVDPSEGEQLSYIEEEDHDDLDDEDYDDEDYEEDYEDDVDYYDQPDYENYDYEEHEDEDFEESAKSEPKQVDSKKFKLNDDEIFQVFRQFLLKDVNLLRIASQDFYEQLTELRQPYSEDPAVFSFMENSYNMAKINQRASVSKVEVMNSVSALKGYKKYKRDQIKDSKTLNERFSKLDSIFDEWLDDKSNRFPEFYQYLLASEDPNEIAILQDIQKIIDNSEERVGYYSDKLADELDRIDPRILRRQEFNQILINSYASSKDLFEQSSKRSVEAAVDSALSAAEQVMKERMQKQEEEYQKLLAQLEAQKQLLDSNGITQQYNSPNVNEEEIEEIAEKVDEEPIEEVTEEVIPEEITKNEDEETSEVSEETQQIEEEPSDEFSEKITSLEENEELMQAINENQQDFDENEDEDYENSEDEVAPIEEEDDEDFGEEFELDDEEYEEEETGFFGRLALWPIWKKVAAGVALALVLGAGGCTAYKIVSKPKAAVEQNVEDGDQAYQDARLDAFVRENFAIGDDLLLTVDGVQTNYTISDYVDGKVGLLVKDDSGRALELDKTILRQYIDSDEDLRGKEQAFNTRYDAEHQNSDEDSEEDSEDDRSPISNQGVGVDFGEGAAKDEVEGPQGDEVEEEPEEETEEEPKEEKEKIEDVSVRIEKLDKNDNSNNNNNPADSGSDSLLTPNDMGSGN